MEVQITARVCGHTQYGYKAFTAGDGKEVPAGTKHTVYFSQSDGSAPEMFSVKAEDAAVCDQVGFGGWVTFMGNQGSRPSSTPGAPARVEWYVLAGSLRPYVDPSELAAAGAGKSSSNGSRAVS